MRTTFVAFREKDVSRTRTLTKYEAVKTVRITAERHRAIKQLALDSDHNLLEITDKIVDAGIVALQSRRQQPSAN